MTSGQASQVAVVASGTPDVGARLSVSAGSDTYEGVIERSYRGVWDGAEIKADETGIPLANSALVEGFRVCVRHSDDELRAAIVGVLDDDGSGYGVGPTVDALDSDATQEPIEIHAMAQSAGLEMNSGDPSYGYNPNDGTAEVVLDGVYPSIRRGDMAIVDFGGVLMGTVVSGVETVRRGISAEDQDAEDGVKILVTTLVIEPASEIGDVFEPRKVRVWFNARKAATLEKIPTKTVTLDDILHTPRPITLTSPAALPQTAADIIIEGAEGTALVAKGNIYEQGGGTYVKITEVPEQDFDGELVKPITFHWGLTTVTRGETINREVLGSGDATIPFQSFKLAKSPLTYVADASAPSGRRPELSVYVNGLKWSRATSFYGAQPSDEIYVIKHDAAHDTQIIFGDGELGKRLPTGANNVIASYRHGVGGNVDARTIKRLARPVKGVTAVINPVAASGGEDPPTPAQAREQAIRATLVLGKLVALPDFEVEAERWGGVVQARAEWDWDPAADQAVVNLWIVAPGVGDPSVELQGYLQQRAEPGTRVRVRKAKRLGWKFSFELEADPNYIRADVYDAVHARLWGEQSGFFAPRNAIIGRAPLLRSRLYAALHEIPGVVSARVVHLYGEIPPGYVVEEGKYLAPVFASLQPNF